MYDGGKIVPGLAAFVAVMALPIWLNVARSAEPRVPEIAKPAGGEPCILDAPAMRREHMQILVTWRDDVVRNQDRVFVMPGGRPVRKSLTGTCLGCHTDKKASCDRCHDYLSVRPYCWDCHLEKGAAR